VAYSLAITLTCADGAAATFRQVLTEITPPSRAEEGSLAFATHQSPDDENVFFVYESYVDEQAYEAHLATPAFKRVEEELFPLVTEREVREYVTLVT
jgi:quinol monooxygenase YgiN